MDQRSLFTLFTCLLQFAVARHTYLFRKGTNETIAFHHELSGENSSYKFEIFARTCNESFYNVGDGVTIPNNLLLGQEGRLKIHVTRMGKNLTIYLNIYEVAQCDSTGVYIVNLTEINDIHDTRHIIYYAYVHVVLPPGKAECDIRLSPYSAKLYELHCRATVGSDFGRLACYQNSNRSPFYGPVRYAEYHVTASFWMFADTQINCCSFEAGFEKDADSCIDFVYLPPDLRVTTVSSETSYSSIKHDDTRASTTDSLPTSIHGHPVASLSADTASGCVGLRHSTLGPMSFIAMIFMWSWTPTKDQRYLVFILVTCLLQIAASLQILSLRQGMNATITFHHELSREGSLYIFEIFSLMTDYPFYMNGAIVPTALDLHQRGRFQVDLERMGRSLTIIVHINILDDIDGGVYIVSLRETNEGKYTNYIYDAFIEVVLPPGKPTCDIELSPHIDDYLELHCRARVSSDGGGVLACYQNADRAPFIQPTTHTTYYMTAVFWMSKNSQINCCSYYNANYDKDPDPPCNDITYLPPGVQVSSGFTPTISSPIKEGDIRASTTDSSHTSMPGNPVASLSADTASGCVGLRQYTLGPLSFTAIVLVVLCH